MNVQLILAGVGGQGILFATRIFSETALAQGFPVIGSETHGMSQRGGSVISHLKIGHYQSPLVRQGTADFVFAFDPAEAYRTLAFLKRGGVCFVNASPSRFPEASIKARLEEREIEVWVINADQIALSLDSPPSANVALIGFALSHPAVPFPYEGIKETILRASGERFKEANLKALEAGYEEGGRQQKEGELGGHDA
ncbi:MAG: indolepyruvate oxidoreductase subunit beta [Anaerolineae bacterium]